MPHIIEIVVLPGEREKEDIFPEIAARQLGIPLTAISHVQIQKASLDARSKQAFYRIRLAVYEHPEQYIPEPSAVSMLKQVHQSNTCIIVGAGPAGYFAALELLELGIKPIVLDRGKDVRARRRDLRAIQQFGTVHPHSNYCFGEGGAGTYSDGKLYTRSVKRGSIQKTLKLLVEHGAQSDILVEAHPHIGSNKLPNVVQNIRETIINHGGEVHFEHYVTDFIVQNGRMAGVIVDVFSEDGAKTSKEIMSDAVVLATGHSARDMYTLLDRKNINITLKPFALGVRIEHPQPLIDSIQYKSAKRAEELPAASYSLVCQVQERGVFSFCMCPGGLIVPAATAPGEIVVNGMSMSRRDSPFANSGLVTSIEPEDLSPWQKHGAFAAMALQEQVEQTLFKAGDGSQKGPALRLTDFINRKLSATLPDSSYIPGLYAAPLFDLLPNFIYRRISEGLRNFGKQMHGFYTEEANVVATESRTSSPIKIPRDQDTLMHPDMNGLFPCGEGAGYAGGIISAAMDGQRVAQAVGRFLEK